MIIEFSPNSLQYPTPDTASSATDDAASDCLDVCDRLNIDNQPERVKTYLQMLYNVVCPILELCCAFCVWRFPIKGDRLRELYATQGKVFEVDTPLPGKKKVRGKGESEEKSERRET